MPRKKKLQQQSSSDIPSSNSRKGRGKSTFNSLKSLNKDKPQQRNAANARERARMRVLSRAFCRLKTTLPWVPADTKLSKLDTLRLASSYIGHLKGILQDDPFKPEEPMHPSLNLSWPFGFNLCRIGGSSGGGISSGSVGGSGEESDVDTLDDGISSCSWDEMKSGESKELNLNHPPPVSCVHLDPNHENSQLLHHQQNGLNNMYVNNNNNNCYNAVKPTSDTYHPFYNNHPIEQNTFTHTNSMYNDINY